jgi:predicted GNAT family acetyltransferase
VSTTPTAEPVVRRDDDRHRYEVLVDDAVVGHLAFKERPNAVVLVHTETDDAAQGQGLAARLVRATLDDLRARGRRVVVRCPYVRRFIDEHPEYADLELVEGR